MIKKIIIVVSLVLSLVGCQPKTLGNVDEQERFDEVRQAMVLDYASSSTASLHFMVLNRDAFGIKDVPVKYGDFDLDFGDKGYKLYSDQLETLKTFNKNDLTTQQQEDLEVHIAWLHNKINELRTINMAFLFNEDNGLVNTVKIVLMEYEFYNKRDVEEYVTMLSDIPTYLSKGLEFTKKQANDGYYMYDSTIDSTVSTINRLLSKNDDNALIVSFDRRIDDLKDLSIQEKVDFKAQNKKAIIDEVLPSIQQVKDELLSLKGKRNENDLLTESISQGSDYYSTLIKSKTSTNKSPQQIFKELSNFYQKEVDKVQKASMGNPSLLENIEYNSDDSCEEVLSKLNDMSKNIIGSIPEVKVDVQYLDVDLADNNTAAYYLVPCIDDYQHNVIKVNPSEQDDALGLVTLLAHEGYPGHLLQNVVYRSTKPNNLRLLNDFIGYSEGWAVYSQSLAVNNNLPFTDDEKVLYSFMDVSDFFVVSFIDLNVHINKWKVVDIVENLGVDEETAKHLYYTVVGNPGMFIPYAYGYMKMSQYRENAEAKCKNFDEKKFHDMLLHSGEVPFELLDKKVDVFIKNN